MINDNVEETDLDTQTSVCGLNCTMSGLLSASRAFIITGSFSGDLSSSEIMVTETGFLEGTIRSETLQSFGKISASSLIAKGDLILMSSSKLSGTVTCGSIFCMKGAEVNAKISNSPDVSLANRSSPMQEVFKLRPAGKLNKKANTTSTQSFDEKREEITSNKKDSLSEIKSMKRGLSVASISKINSKAPEAPFGTGKTNPGYKPLSNNEFNSANQKRGAVVLAQKQKSITVDQNNIVSIEKKSE